MPARRIFVYIRGDTESCGKQRVALHAFCEKEGQDWTRVTVCEDQGASGFSKFETRAAGYRLLDMIRPLDRLIVCSLDRISLDAPELLRVLAILADVNVTFEVMGGAACPLDDLTLDFVVDALRTFGHVPRYDH